MKLRIKDNSIRLRLTKTEIAAISEKGHVEAYTRIGPNGFGYALIRVDDAENLSASYIDDCLIVFIPEKFTRDWPTNDIVGFDARIPLQAGESLYILVEKDFACIDETTEDQSDMYPNPNQTC